MTRSIALLVFLLFATAAAAADELADKARATLAQVLREPTAAKRRALVEPLAKAGPISAISKALRLGPKLPKDARAKRRGDKFTKVGNTTVGYSFSYDGERYVYAVNVPDGYDPGKPAPVLLDPGHASIRRAPDAEKAGALDFYRRMLDQAGCKDWLVVRSHIVEMIGADAKNKPEEYGSLVFQELFRDLATRFAIDPDRIYCTGLSQTGFWAWMLGRARSDRFAGIAPMGAVVWEVTHYPANFVNLPVFVLHGEKDPVCPVGPVRGVLPVLARHGVAVRYLELEGAAHDGSVWSTLPRALEHLKKTPRVRYPKRVSKSLSALHDGWCHWLRIDAIDKPGQGRSNDKPAAGLDAEREGQTFRIHSEGVRKITLCLADEMADLDQPIVVEWNGKEVFRGKVERNVFTLFELAHERSDWTAIFPAALTLTAP